MLPLAKRNNALQDPAFIDALDTLTGNDKAVEPSINALWLPAMMLADNDPRRCRRLIAKVLTQQREDGLLVDSAVASGTEAGSTVAAWPLWACVAARVQRRFPDEAWVGEIQPALRKAFFAAMTHFDPERIGLPCRRSATEAWDARNYRDNLATPDLPVLLLMEIDALRQLRTQPDTQLVDEREQLIAGLLEFMSDPLTGLFDARRVGGGREPASPRMAVFPLLWPGLPGVWIGRLLMHAEFGLIPALRDAAGYTAATEIWMWRRTLTRLGAWGLLKRIDDGCRRKQFATLDFQSPEPLRRYTSVAAAQSLAYDTGAGGGIITSVIRRLRPQGTALTMAATVCLLLAAGWGMFHREPTVDAVTLALWQQQARTATALGDATASRDIDATLQAAGVFEPYREMVSLQLAEQRGEWSAAAAIYERLRQQEGDTPLIIFGLARAKGRMGQHQEAREYGQLFIDRYGDTFPAAARAARAEWWRMEQDPR